SHHPGEPHDRASHHHPGAQREGLARVPRKDGAGRKPRRRAPTSRTATGCGRCRASRRVRAERRLGLGARVGGVNARILILGAGFGGLELATILSEALGQDAGVTVIDKSDAFVFGYSKLDVMFGRTTLDAVRLPYRDIAKP